TPFPVGPVNVILVEGDPLTLVDTGPKSDVSRAGLEAGLGSLGYRIEDLRRIIVTHHHADHLGLAAEIVARSCAEVWAHPYTAPRLADFAAQQARSRPFYDQVWAQAGVPGDILALMNDANRSLLRWLDPVPVTGTLGEGDRLSLGGVEWQIFHTPGHA